MAETATDLSLRSAGIELYARVTVPAAPEAPTLLLLPGLGFHSFEYVDLAARLASRGLATIAFDYRGHGRSGGVRGRWTLADLVADTRAVTDWAVAHRAAPVVLFGNSLGGMVSLLAAKADKRIAAVAASNCPARIGDFLLTPTRRVLLACAKAVAPIVPLRISVNHFYGYEQLIDDAAWVERISRDPLIGPARRLSVAAYRSLIEDWDGPAEVARLDRPLLLLSGERDALQPAEQTERLAAAARGPVTHVRFDAGHLPHLQCPEAVAECVAGWIRAAVRPERQGSESAPGFNSWAPRSATRAFAPAPRPSRRGPEGPGPGNDLRR